MIDHRLLISVVAAALVLAGCAEDGGNARDEDDTNASGDASGDRAGTNASGDAVEDRAVPPSALPTPVPNSTKEEAASDGPSGSAALLVSRSLTTISPGESVDIKVAARNAMNDVVPFVANASGSCFAVNATATSVRVTALSGICTDTLVISAPQTGQEKRVTIDVIDPMTMDIGEGLLIRYTNQYHWRWDDRGSQGRWDHTFWHPQAPTGFYPVGSVIRGDHGGAPSGVATIVVQDSKGAGTLAAPIRFDVIWTDSGSGADNDGSVWKPVCPSGYSALGAVVAAGHGAPSIEDVRCVKSTFTTRGTIGPQIANDEGSGANANMAAWQIGLPSALPGNDDRRPFLIDTSIACPGHSVSDCAGQMDAVNVLMVPLPVVEATDNQDAEPKLTGYQPLDTTIPRFFSGVRMPFTMIPATSAKLVDHNVKYTPFYTVLRVEDYTTLPNGIIDNRQGSKDVTKGFEIQTGFEKGSTETFSHTVGSTVPVGGDVGAAKWEAELSYEFGWEGSTSRTFSESETSSMEFTIPAGAYAQIVQVTTRFMAVDETGNALPAELAGASSIVKYLEYKG